MARKQSFLRLSSSLSYSLSLSRPLFVSLLAFSTCLALSLAHKLKMRQIYYDDYNLPAKRFQCLANFVVLPLLVRLLLFSYNFRGFAFVDFSVFVFFLLFFFLLFFFVALDLLIALLCHKFGSLLLLTYFSSSPLSESSVELRVLFKNGSTQIWWTNLTLSLLFHLQFAFTHFSQSEAFIIQTQQLSLFKLHKSFTSPTR